MKETNKTKEQLINELRETRQRISELEARHKKELAELKPMEQKYQNIFDISPNGIITADIKGIITSCNEAFLELSGYSKEEIVGKHFTKLPTLRASDMPRWIKLFASILVRKEIKPIEFAWIRKDGTSRTGEFRISLIKEDRRTAGVLCVVWDVTERKQVENALRESEERYRTLIDTGGSAGLGIMVIQDTEEHEATIVFSNTQASNIFGYGAEELRGKPFWRLVTPETVAVMKERNRKRKEGENVVHTYEAVGVRKDGEQVQLEISSSMMTYNGKPATVTYIKDITERKQAEEALRISEERYRTLVNTAGDAGLGIIVIQDTEDQEGAVVFSNDLVREITGYSPEELRGKPVWSLIALESITMVKERYRNRQEINDNISTYETDGICKDGKRIPIEVSTGLITYDGKPSVVAYIKDVTERKELEEERQKTERLDSIGLLAGGIAHDFNNYLTSIIGNISLARKYVESRSVAGSHLLEAEEAVIEAKELTQQLLTFARGGSPVKKNTSIGNLIEDTTKFALRGSNVKPEFSIPDDLWAAEVDASQIRQVISNIVINAAEAMHEGGFIQVKAENYTISKKGTKPLQKGNYLRLIFTDHGTGIPEKHLKRIFDPYFTTKKSGNGLGLATTYSIMKAHGGHIEVESQSGVGTVFRVILPASKKPIRKRKPKKKLHQLSLVKGSRVLVMDDNKAIRKMLDIALGMVYEVALAADGAETIKLYSEALENGNPFDVVIMDLTIPGGIGGQEAIEELLKIDPNATVIVSSGYSDHRIMSSYQKYGFSGVISKPYVIDELKEMIQELLKRKRKVQQTTKR